MSIVLTLVALAATGYALFEVARRGGDEFVSADRLSKGAWIGILLGALLLALLPVVLLKVAAFLGAGAYFGWAMPALGQAEGRRAPTTPAASPAPTAQGVRTEPALRENLTATNEVNSGSPEGGSPAPATSTPNGLPAGWEDMSPFEAVSAIRDEAVEKGFFLKHKVKKKKATRKQPASATMTATSTTSSKFEIVVKVVEYPYGTKIETFMQTKGNPDSAVAVGLSAGGALSQGIAGGLQARKERKLQEAAEGVEMELQAFIDQVLDKYMD